MQTKSSKGAQRKEEWRYCQREERKLKSTTDEKLVCAIVKGLVSVCNEYNLLNSHICM